jgi:hypothetical protein
MDVSVRALTIDEISKTISLVEDNFEEKCTSMKPIEKVLLDYRRSFQFDDWILLGCFENGEELLGCTLFQTTGQFVHGIFAINYEIVLPNVISYVRPLTTDKLICNGYTYNYYWQNYFLREPDFISTRLDLDLTPVKVSSSEIDEDVFRLQTYPQAPGLVEIYEFFGDENNVVESVRSLAIQFTDLVWMCSDANIIQKLREQLPINIGPTYIEYFA